LTNLHKYIKNKKVVTESEEPKDTDMREEFSKKERSAAHNVYSDEDRRRYFYFILEKLMAPSQAAKDVNVDYKTVRKLKKHTTKTQRKKHLLKKRIVRQISLKARSK
jgi:hypothetical protein